MTTFQTTFDDFDREARLSSGTVLHNFHLSGDCYGDVCPVHKPSEHGFRDNLLDFNMEMFMFVRILQNVPAGGINFVPDPDDYKFLQTGQAILRNTITCDACKDVIESHYRHDFVTCRCGAVSVDGGHDYLRRVGSDFVDNSVVFRNLAKDMQKMESTSAIRNVVDIDDKSVRLIDKRYQK